MRLKIFTFIVSLCTANFVWAQGSTERMYSIAFKGASFETLPKILNDKNSDYFTFVPVGEISFLFNENQLSYRLNVNMYHVNKEILNSSANDELIKGNAEGYSVSFGVIKNITYATIQPYYGFDLGYKYQKYIGNSDNVAANYEASTSKSGGFIAPTVGLKWNIVPDFTVFVESGLQVYLNYERVNQKYTNGNYTFNKFQKVEFLANPIKFGLQISLGSI